MGQACDRQPAFQPFHERALRPINRISAHHRILFALIEHHAMDAPANGSCDRRASWTATWTRNRGAQAPPSHLPSQADLIRLADRPSALQTARLRRPSPGLLKSGVSAAEAPLAPGLGKAWDDTFRRRLLAPLPEQRKVASMRGPNLLSAW